MIAAAFFALAASGVLLAFFFGRFVGWHRAIYMRHPTFKGWTQCRPLQPVAFALWVSACFLLLVVAS